MILRAAALFLVGVSLPVFAEECLSVSRSSVSYEVQQAGSPFRGPFRRFGGEICLSGERATRSDVWLEPASVDTGLPEIDAALRGKEFFAVNEYPKVTYNSRSVEAGSGGRIAHGVLQMKGKRGSVDVPFTLQRKNGEIVVSGTLALNRLAYDIGTGEWSNTKWLGAEVKVDFQATLSTK